MSILNSGNILGSTGGGGGGGGLASGVQNAGIVLNNTDTGQEIVMQEVGTNFLRFFDAGAFGAFVKAPLGETVNIQGGTTGDKVVLWSGNGSRRLIAADAGVGVNEEFPDYTLDVNGPLGFTPGASVTPVDNGDVVIEATNNTTLTFKLKGSDATVRSATLTLS